jgi:hypothetical protein
VGDTQTGNLISLLSFLESRLKRKTDEGVYKKIKIDFKYRAKCEK